MQTLRNGLVDDIDWNFYTVVGQSGYGKTALLDEFAEECREEDIPVVKYKMGEPETFRVFLRRLLQRWADEFRTSFKDKFDDSVSSDDLWNVAGVVSRFDIQMGFMTVAAAKLRQYFGNDIEDIDETTDPLSFVLDIIEAQAEKEEKIVIIVDQYDVERFNDDVFESFNRKFREIASSLPDNVIWYLGASKQIPLGSSDIYTRELESLDEEYTRELIQQWGFSVSSDVVGEVYNRTNGHPYFLTELLRRADNTGLERALNLLPECESDVYEYLKENTMDDLNKEQMRVLISSAVLYEIRSEIIAESLDINDIEAEKLLTELRDRAILKKRYEENKTTVYQCHDILRDYILNNSTNEYELRVQAAAAYLKQATKLIAQLQAEGEPTIDVRIDRFSNYMVGFDRQLSDLHQVKQDINQNAQAILAKVPDQHQSEVSDALERYYSSELRVRSEPASKTILDSFDC